MSDNSPLLRVEGRQLANSAGSAVRLRGVGLGGWLNMENFITGYPANEAAMRASVRNALGERRYEFFFDRLLTVFFDANDASFLADTGVNCVRLPVNYRHLESDDAPFVTTEEGFRHLDRVIRLCAERGIYTIIDLHAVQGYQNHEWHSDNPTHVAGLWNHPHFQDRLVHLWEVIADRYKDNPWVAGYNPINEPADESRTVIGPLYTRLVRAIRAVDPHHILFLDGNTYSTEFDFCVDPWENTVYTCHDYALAGFVRGGPYPGGTDGIWVDKNYLEAKFKERTAYQEKTNTPIWVGEFGPVYTGDQARDEQRLQILRDQLDIYRSAGASWALWTYKDIGLQGVVYAAPDTPYRRRFDEFLAKKARLGVDAWGGLHDGVKDVLEPLQQLVAREFPDHDPYPFGLAPPRQPARPTHPSRSTARGRVRASVS